LRQVETYLQKCLPEDTGFSVQFSKRNCLKKINQRWGRDEKLTLDISITKNGGNSDYTLSFCQSSIGDWFYLSPDPGSQQNFISMIKQHGLKTSDHTSKNYIEPQNTNGTQVDISKVTPGLCNFLQGTKVKIYCDMDNTTCEERDSNQKNNKSDEVPYDYFWNSIRMVKTVSRSTGTPIHIVTAAEAPIHMRNVMYIFKPSDIASVTSAEGLVEVENDNEKDYLKFVQPDNPNETDEKVIYVIFDDRPDVWRISSDCKYILIQPDVNDRSKCTVITSSDITFDSANGQFSISESTGSTAFPSPVSKQTSINSNNTESI
jgi:hypothetical protein